MGLKFQTQESSYELHEDGEYYTGIISGYEEIDPAPPYNKAQVKWLISLDGEEESPLWYFTSAKLTTGDKNKLRKLLLALGEDPDSGEVFDADDIVGRRVRVLLEHHQTKTATGEKVTRERITSIKATK